MMDAAAVRIAVLMVAVLCLIHCCFAFSSKVDWRVALV